MNQTATLVSHHLDPEILVMLLSRAAIAAFFGAIIGLEREFNQKAAGVRTNMVVCMTCCLLAILSQLVSLNSAGMRISDPARISAQVASGIGFLAAGCIVKSGGMVSGLTTAATIWIMAAIGMFVGYGYVLASTILVVTVLLVLTSLYQIERWFKRRYLEQRIHLHLANGENFSACFSKLAETGIKIQRTYLTSENKADFDVEYFDRKHAMMQKRLEELKGAGHVLSWTIHDRV